jgi:hypothetical protein
MDAELEPVCGELGTTLFVTVCIETDPLERLSLAPAPEHFRRVVITWPGEVAREQ